VKTSMDVIQFGKWFSERRRKCGWSSQRALAETLRNDPFLQTWRVSEDFIARLEAGRLAYPFRGQVRQQILVLAQVLCKTSRDVQSYLRAASLKELSPEETLLVQRIHNYLALERVATVELLPARPVRLVGRDTLVQDLLAHIDAHGQGLYAITGMPGVGKSVLAYEVMHRIAYHELRRHFPDGIVTLSCRERKGLSGLISLLSEVIDIFAATDKKYKRQSVVYQKRAASLSSVPAVLAMGATSSAQFADGISSQGEDRMTAPAGERDLAGVIDRVRMVLAQKSICFLLDDLDSQFPLQEALSALCGYMYPGDTVSVHGSVRRLILTTSRFIPAVVHIDYHCALDGLDLSAACTLFESLIAPEPLDNKTLCSQNAAATQQSSAGHISSVEYGCIEQICTALGCLPLAIVYAAHVFIAERIPISLLTAQLVTEPLYGLFSVGQHVGAVFEQALRQFESEKQTCFALLALIGARSFSLETAASLFVNSSSALLSDAAFAADDLISEHGLDSLSIDDDATGIPLAALTGTAIILGRFVSHSLIIRVEMYEDDFTHNPRYRLHPLLYAYARQRLRTLAPELVSQAQAAILRYAESYLERYQGNVAGLEREQDFLLAMVDLAWLRRQYAQVVRLTSRLFPVVEHLADPTAGIEILRRAVQASYKIDDNYSLSYLNSYLGLLYCYHGQVKEAHACWQESLIIAKKLGAPPHLWRPYIYLAHLAYLQGDVHAAYTLADTFLQRVKESGDLRSLATAYLKRGSYRRMLKDTDLAYDDVCTALSLIFMLDAQASSSDQLLELEARTELARVLGDQKSAACYLESAYALAEMNSDPYARALLLLDKVDLEQKPTISPSAAQLRLPQPIVG
jgi:hypothetical protein